MSTDKVSVEARYKETMEARSAFKAWEIEENLDRFFFRPAALVFTDLFARLSLSPNQVSVLGMVVGLGAAPLLFSGLFPHRLLAITLLWLAEVLDASDGQLARLTSKTTPHGRVVDGVCGLVVIMAVDGVIGAGLYQRTGHALYIVLAALAILSNGLHSMFYDFFRGEYIRVVKHRRGVSPGSPFALARTLDALPAGAFWPRLFVRVHYRFALGQVAFTSSYQRLVRRLETGYGDGMIPVRFTHSYRVRQRPLVRWWNYLGPNAHLILTTACIAVGRPSWILWFNLVGFNLYAAVLSLVQTRATGALIEDLARAERREPAPAPETDRVLSGAK